MYHIEVAGRPRRVARLRYELTLRITNASDFTWNSKPEADGVNLGWWWCFQHQDSNPRTFAFRDYEPGSSKLVTVTIDNPPETGRYTLHIDLVREHRYWFRQRSSGAAVVDVRVDREGHEPWIVFQDLCVRLAAFLPKQYPAIDPHASRKTLLVESRPLPHLDFVIRNTVQKMGEGWGHVIYCSPLNQESIREIYRGISPGIEIRLLECDINSRNDYNNLCLDAGFWRGLGCEHVLVYQSDAILMKPFDERFLCHDYIGASWAPGPHLAVLQRALGFVDDVVQGNGGLSLRSVPMLLRALDDAAFRDRYLDCPLEGYLERAPEDVYFALYASRHGAYVRETRAFSIEPAAGHKERLEPGDDPFGYHKPFGFPDFERHLVRSFRSRGDDALVDLQARVRGFSPADCKVTRNDDGDRTPCVSVIVALYEYEDYIAEWLRSVFDQGFPDLEIIVVNDGSRDRSLAVASGFLSRALPMTIIDKPTNTGVVHCRNLAIGHARGDYLFMLDADNTLLPGCIEAHVEAIRATGSMAAYGIVECVDHAGVRLQTVSDRPFDPEALREMNYIDNMALFDRRWLIELGCYDPGLLDHGPGYEDWELWLRIAHYGAPVSFIDRVLSRYRLKEGGLNARVVQLYQDAIVDYLSGKYPEIAPPRMPGVLHGGARH